MPTGWNPWAAVRKVAKRSGRTAFQTADGRVLYVSDKALKAAGK